MDGTGGNSRASGFGRVTILPASGPPAGPPTEAGISPVVDRSLYVWEPDDDVAADLPTGFRLTLECVATRDGTRRFAPAGGVAAFLLEASLGGLAILNRVRGMSAEARFSYHAMRLIFQHAPRLREHLGRSFSRRADLSLTAAEKGGRDGRSILPARIGLDREGHGRRWSVAELLEQGRDRAIAAGLFAAARRDPLDPGASTESEARGLVRLALFDRGPVAGGIGVVAKQAVTERLLAAIETHQDDDAETFTRWFFEDRDNLIHQIAKQRKRGGPHPREVVRQAVLDLVFDAYTYAGDCVCLQMQAFLEALPTPLDAGERAWFEAVYYKQPYLGGLPLVLIRERFTFLREAILDLMDDPGDGERVGVLLRLLQYYEEMATQRRDADRGDKRRAHHRDAGGRIGRTVELDVDVAAKTERTPAPLFQQIADQLREERGITCSCGAAGSWHAELLGGVADDPIRIGVVCPGCQQSLPLELSRAEFRRLGQEGS